MNVDVRPLSPEDTRRLRLAAVAIGHDRAYTGKTVVMLCDALLDARKQIEVYDAICKTYSEQMQEN